MMKSVWILTRVWLCLFLFLFNDVPSSLGCDPIVPFPNQKQPSKVSSAEQSEIKRSNDPVWFDSTDGTVRPISKSGSIYVDDRHDSVAGPTAASPPGWWSAFFKNIADLFSWLFQGWQVLLLLFLIPLLILIGFAIYYYATTSSSQRGMKSNLSRSEIEKAKILDLPFEVEQSMFGLLAQAERYRAAGDFSKAIVYLFSYALVEMDGARCIRLERGKTNRVYLRELKDRENLLGFTSQIILAFEYSFFGKHVLNQASFERIWQQLPAFEATLKQTAASPGNTIANTFAGRT